MLLAKTNGAVEGMKWCNLKTNSAHANRDIILLGQLLLLGCYGFCKDGQLFKAL